MAEDLGWHFDALSELKALTTTGGHVWPASRRLAEFLQHEHRNIGMHQPGATILELGAGCGFLGVTVARNLPHLGSICLTEQEEGEGLAWLQHNVMLNLSKPGVNKIAVAPCDWNDFCMGDESRMATVPAAGFRLGTATQQQQGTTGTNPALEKEASVHVQEAHEGDAARPAVGSLAPSTGRPWDFILGSDLIYTEQGCEALPKVMRALATAGHTQVYYCHTKHRFDHLDLKLMDELDKCGLSCEEVREAGQPTPPPSPPPLTELYPDMRIAIFRIAFKDWLT